LNKLYSYWSNSKRNDVKLTNSKNVRQNGIANAADQYNKGSDLTRRVQQWEAKIAPILQEEVRKL
jgi:hypothetical protein